MPSEAAKQAVERRVREDEAPRLSKEVPSLTSLRLEIVEHRAEGGMGEIQYIRRIPVEHAPARFEIGCTDERCVGGGHDLTREVMDVLRRSQLRFEATSTCCGGIGTALCDRELHVVGVASYLQSLESSLAS